MKDCGPIRAAILVETNKPLLISEIDLPSELMVGQVLVRIKFSGICGSQIGEIDGVKGVDKFLPHLLGHEGAGEVIAIGPGVKNLDIGDKVVLHWRPGKGIESEPPVYGWNGGRLNAGWVTTFNDHAVVSENRLTKIDQNSDLRIATLFGCAITTGLGVVENNAQISMGESVVVFGAGGIGLSIIQGASLRAAHPIIAVDRYDNKLDLAKKLGATHCINSSVGDVGKNLSNILRNGIDIFIDNTGSSEVIELGYGLLSSKGRVILVGVPKFESKTSINTLPLHFGKKIIGSHGGGSEPAVDIPRYFRLYESGKLDLSSIITNTYSLENINQAISDMRMGKITGRCLIDMDMDAT